MAVGKTKAELKEGTNGEHAPRGDTALAMAGEEPKASLEEIKRLISRHLARVVLRLKRQKTVPGRG